jgi:hypothetical protein
MAGLTRFRSSQRERIAAVNQAKAQREADKESEQGKHKTGDDPASGGKSVFMVAV